MKLTEEQIKQDEVFKHFCRGIKTSEDTLKELHARDLAIRNETIGKCIKKLRNVSDLKESSDYYRGYAQSAEDTVKVLFSLLEKEVKP